ncbi:phosphate acyltransferase, partial [Nitratifractor sp.]
MSNETIRSAYVLAREPGAGASLFALGLGSFLRRRFARIGMFRPVAPEGEDRDLQTLREVLRLPPETVMSAYRHDEAFALLETEGIETLLEGLVERFHTLRKSVDFVLILGHRDWELAERIETDPDLLFARNLSSPVIGIFRADGRDAEAIRTEARIWGEAIGASGAPLWLLCANRVDPRRCDDLRGESLEDTPLLCLPESPELSTPTLADLVRTLGARALLEREGGRLDRGYGAVFPATGSVRRTLASIRGNELVVCGADRDELLYALVLASRSDAVPPVAGIVLEGEADAGVRELLEKLEGEVPPIVESPLKGMELLRRLEETEADITPDNRRRIEAALGLFERHIDARILERRLHRVPEPIVTPVMFRLEIFERARRQKTRILLPEAEDERILRAAEILLRREILTPVFVAPPDVLKRKSRRLGIDLSGADVIDPDDPDLRERFARRYYELRRDKGVGYPMALDRMADRTVFAVMALEAGLGDGLVSGAVHTTRETLVPAFRIIGTKSGDPIASSCFFMCLPTRVLVYADCAVNPDPTPE